MLEVEQPHGAEHIAEAAAQKARDAGVGATPHAPRGEVADVLGGAATKLGVDLLVVGSRGHGPLAGAVLGSVSHALVSRSPVPLTIVRHGVAGS
jgi:nucleotide-binding universal stress UspA family protein